MIKKNKLNKFDVTQNPTHYLLYLFVLFSLSPYFYIILANPHRLDDFICMKPGKNPDLGKVYDLLHFVQAFFRTNIDNNNTKTQN